MQYAANLIYSGSHQKHMANVIHSPSSISVQMQWWQIFKHQKLLIKTEYFYEEYSLLQSQSQDIKQAGFLSQFLLS